MVVFTRKVKKIKNKFEKVLSLDSKTYEGNLVNLCRKLTIYEGNVTDIRHLTRT